MKSWFFTVPLHQEIKEFPFASISIYTSSLLYHSNDRREESSFFACEESVKQINMSLTNLPNIIYWQFTFPKINVLSHSGQKKENGSPILSYLQTVHIRLHVCEEEETRTPTSQLTLPPQSSASTNSATSP